MVRGSSAAGAGPVVICCATADEAAISPVLDALEQEGHTVSLLAGVEMNPSALAPAVERFHGEGLYVLCRSKALSRDTVDALRDILLANHVPFGRTLTVASTRPRELRERIGASLRRMAAGRARKMSTVSPDGAKLRSTYVGLPSPIASPPDQPLAAPAPEEDAERAEAPSPRRTQMGIAPPPQPAPEPEPEPKPAPTPDEETDGGTFAEEIPTNAALAAPEPKPAPAKASAPPPLPPPPPAAAPKTAPREDSLSSPSVISPDDLADLDALELSGSDFEVEEDDDVSLRVAVRSGNTQVVPALPRSALDAIRTGDTAIVSREALIAAGLRDPAPPSRSETPAAPPSSPAFDPAAESARAATPSASASAAVPSSPTGTRDVPWKWIGVGAGALALLTVLVVAVSGGEDDEDAPAEDDGAVARVEDNASEDAVDEAPDAPPTDADDPPPAPAADPRTLVGQALRNREIQALDVLLVSNTEGPFTYDDARSHCDGLEIAGLATWRLPEVGELMSLTGASMTGRGYYWSATPADTFGDVPLVWYARRSRVVTRTKDNYVLCVRGGTGAG